jgi:antitoxin ParD1/3/4
MAARYVLAPEAALDLVEIWRYIKKQSSIEIADRVEFVIREKIALLAANPGAGHSRRNLTDENVKFFPAYSYLIVYRPESTPPRSRAPPQRSPVVSVRRPRAIVAMFCTLRHAGAPCALYPFLFFIFRKSRFEFHSSGISTTGTDA